MPHQRQDRVVALATMDSANAAVAAQVLVRDKEAIGVNTLRLIFFDFELPNSMVEMNAAEGADPILLMAGYIANTKIARFPFGKAPELNVFDRWNRDREKFSPPNKVAKDCCKLIRNLWAR
jgi:hypothetical protein